MTTHDWLVRVSELSQGVESRDRVIAEQRRRIARLLEIVDELRAKLVRQDAGKNASQPPSTQRPTRRRKGDRSNGSASENP
jgi:hypothetical protein